MLSVGQTVGNYRITRLLGEGGMGQVFEAHQEEIGKRVAIKALHGNLAEHPEAVSRFLNEARAVNVIGHPSLVNIFESGRLPDGAVYIIMEFLEGEPLTNRIQNGGLTIADSMRLTRQVASALQAAHNKGIVHRGQLRPKIPSRNRDLNGCVQTLGKQGKIAELAPFVDGSQERGAFRGSHRAQQRKHRFCARWGGAGF